MKSTPHVPLLPSVTTSAQKSHYNHSQIIKQMFGGLSDWWGSLAKQVMIGKEVEADDRGRRPTDVLQNRIRIEFGLREKSSGSLCELQKCNPGHMRCNNLTYYVSKHRTTPNTAQEQNELQWLDAHCALTFVWTLWQGRIDGNVEK